MNHRPRPGRNDVRATSTYFKWISIAVFILFLGLQTIPSSTNFVQREEITTRKYEMIHHMRAGPTSSPFTKAMKVVLHNLPARRSESGRQDNTLGLARSPDGKQQKEEYDSSNELNRHDHETTGNSQINDKNLNDATPSKVEKPSREAIRDLIGHDKTGCLSSTMECFCKFTKRCKRDGIRANTAYNSVIGKNERAVLSKHTEGEVARRRSSPEVQVDHLAQLAHAKKETEKTMISTIPHRPWNPSPKLAHYRSNEREVISGLFEKSSYQQESDFKVDRPLDPEIHDVSSDLCLHALDHYECRSSTLQGHAPSLGGSLLLSSSRSSSASRLSSGSRKALSFAGLSSIINSNSLQNHRQSLYKRNTRNGDTKSTACHRNESSTSCQGGEPCQLQYLRENMEGEVFASPDAGEQKTRRQLTVTGRYLIPDHLSKAGSTAAVPRDDRTEPHTFEHSAKYSLPPKRDIDRASLHKPHHLDNLSIGKSSTAQVVKAPAQEELETIVTTMPKSILERRLLHRIPWHHRPTDNLAQTDKALKHALRRESTLLEAITEAKCSDRLGRDKDECEQNHRTGFWIVCSVLAVAGTCGLLLGTLVLHLHFRRKRPSPLLTSGYWPAHKRVVSTPVTSVSEIHTSKAGRPLLMRRIEEDEIDETGSVRRYTTLDGTNDGWTRWIHKQKGGAKISQKGRFSSTTGPTTAAQASAPRIPTLKLPQTTLAATMRKINGLGSERESASQGYHTWKGKGKDMTKVKWCSTV
ncbi:hypothetical protein V8E51_003324 [Hyaloscypha variabilis]